MSHTHTKKSAKSAARQEDSFAQKALRAFLWTLLFAAGLLLVASLAVYFLPDPDPAIRPVALLISFLVAFVGGVISGRIHRAAPALCGTLNGCLLLALMLLLSLFFRDPSFGYSLGIALLLHALIPLLSLAGALFGVRKKGRK